GGQRHSRTCGRCTPAASPRLLSGVPLGFGLLSWRVPVGRWCSITGATAACRQNSGAARCRDAQPDSSIAYDRRSQPTNEAGPQSGKAPQDGEASKQPPCLAGLRHCLVSSSSRLVCGTPAKQVPAVTAGAVL